MRNNYLDNIFLVKIKDFDFLKSSDVNSIFNKISQIFSGDDEERITVDCIDNIDYIFFRIEEYKVMQFFSFISEMLECEVLNISKNVISGELDDDILLISLDEQHKDFFDKYRVIYTTIDDILDKITNRGIDSLDDIDKEILSSRYSS